MPGGLAELLLQPHSTGHPSVFKHAESMEKLCFLIFGALEVSTRVCIHNTSISSLFSSDPASLRAKAFAERFKYGVISSSLLSPTFPATPMESHRRSLSPPLPGKLSVGHSRTASVAESTVTDTPSLSMPPEFETPLWPLTLSFTIAVVALSARFYFFAFLLAAATMYYIYIHRRDIHPKPDVMTPSLLALQHLISAGQLWDSVVNDTLTLLENEEQGIFHGPKSPSTPSSSLQLALSTSLLTTQTQCDNVRQLLAAITSPTELSQLAEMYAPPSPIKSTFSRSSDSHRPLSHPGSPPRTSPLGDRTRKRSTWNGSYASLALAGTPPAFQLVERKKRRRSDLSALLGTASPSPARTRSPNTLSTPSQLLADVSEEEGMVTAESSLAEEDEEEHTFGAAALNLYRKRVGGGLRALELSQRSALFTRQCGKTPNHHVSRVQVHLACTQHAIRFRSHHCASRCRMPLASKRFACSHLLALRFEDDEDEVYWEDVRAVMSLLTSTLIDASSRLSETLDDVEEHRLDVDDIPSESASGTNTPSSLASPPPSRLPLSHAIEQIVSFAPTPSHLSRFAAHVSAISSALNDAREHLEHCTASLKEDHVHSPGHSSHPSTSSSGDVLPTMTALSESEHPAIQAYERLRRELGLALRECERGRERLHPPPSPVVIVDRDDLVGTVDDVLEHLPDTSAVHLPPPGIEQVFEADVIVGTLTRARSTLSREERIQLARAAREAEDPAAADGGRAHGWGPSGDVVQRLKDVIWKVGERRRKLTASQMTVVSVSRTIDDVDGEAVSWPGL
ncbi:hypothetical protein JVU11DRAFT_6697 [Chiua virens]|nr:hypothetical protein JVU11DRAFT_6697 [Chiua virens]